MSGASVAMPVSGEGVPVRSAVLRIADPLRSLILLAAFAAVTSGLHTVLSGDGWWRLVLLVSATVFGGSATVGALFVARPLLVRLLSPLVSAGLLAIVLTIVFAPATAFAGAIPTVETIGAFRDLLNLSAYSIAVQTVPATADAPISLLLALGIGLMALLCDIVVFSLRLPALVGLPLAAIFLVPGMAPEGTTDGLCFVLTAVCYLALLAIGRSWRSIPALAIAAVSVIAGLVLPAVLPGTGFNLIANAGGPAVGTGVNPMITLGDDLRRGSNVTVLTYSTSSSAPVQLRLATIRDFSGADWGPGAYPDPRNRLTAFDAPPGLAADVPRRTQYTDVEVGNLLTPWLPAPYPATRITGLTGSWSWQTADLAVYGDRTLAAGQRYTVDSLLVDPTPQQLLDAGARVPLGMASYLTLPEDVPDIVRQTAQQVAGDAGSSYQKAIALQNFFRLGDFLYSEQTPVEDGYDGTGMAVLAKFLEVRKGYCIHFASAMAVMARVLGIPSRIAVGFQSGHRVSNAFADLATYAVTTDDLHAWPELYFDDIGWVRFEPTPGRGALPDYANQSVPGVPEVPEPSTTATAEPDPAPSVSAPAVAPPIDDGPSVTDWLDPEQGNGWLVVLAIAVGACALAAVPALIRLSRRRRRLRALRRGSVMPTWRELLETARDVGVVVPVTFTPAETVERLSRMRGMSEGSRAALTRLGAAVERQAYGPPHRRRLVGAEQLRADARTVIGALLSGRDAGGRMRALLLPVSLFSPVRSADRPRRNFWIRPVRSA